MAGYKFGLAQWIDRLKTFIENASSLTALLARWVLLAGAVALVCASLRAGSVLLDEHREPYGAISPSGTGMLRDGRLVRARGGLVCTEPQRVRISAATASRSADHETMASMLLIREAAWQLCIAQVAGALTKQQYADALLSLIARTRSPDLVRPVAPSGTVKVRQAAKNKRSRTGEAPCRCINGSKGERATPDREDRLASDRISPDLSAPIRTEPISDQSSLSSGGRAVPRDTIIPG